MLWQVSHLTVTLRTKSNSRRSFSSILVSHVQIIISKCSYSSDEDVKCDANCYEITAIISNPLRSELDSPYASSIRELVVIHLPVKTPQSEMYILIAGSRGK
jgi:hypothetical protein